ncbi:MAG: hypothetical protein LBP25_02480 [Tannerellaceae bacterium]|jgi:hypothetical protein|nr:hypothetical protein [Tannerellaceae bacterium]
MQSKLLNSDLIEAIRRSLPPKTNVTNVLMDVLDIGKEAVYRRLRSEVPFTFAEASRIARSLGISLDRITSVHTEDIAVFNLYMMHSEDPFETYYRSAEDFLHNCAAVQGDPSAEWYTASCSIPHAFCMEYEYLAKFLLYKWLYQQDRIENGRYYADLEIPEKIRKVQLDCAEETRSVASSGFIWDEIVFLSLVNDILYFHEINLITDAEKGRLKEELLSMMDMLENLAAKGEYENGNRIYFYISHINFEATYGYLSTEAVKLSLIRLYAINMIYSADPNVFEYQKNWILSLKKYSTLISVSGERQRIRFFEKQRLLIDKL